MRRSRFCSIAGNIACAVLALFIAAGSTAAVAQEIRTGDIASQYVVTDGGVAFGDIVSFNPQTGTYQRTRTVSDEQMFGVVVQNPALLYRSGTATNTVPIVERGEVVVNVTTLNGAIQAGDLITSSPVVGKGQRAQADTPFILGVAQEPFTFASGEATTTPSGETIAAGAIAVKLKIGPNPTQRAASSGVTETTILNIIQYVVAGFVVVGSIYIAFRNFGPNLREGVASIGRNPLARSSIQSMVVFNAVLMILISLGGLFIGVAIILLPI